MENKITLSWEALTAQSYPEDLENIDEKRTMEKFEKALREKLDAAGIEYEIIWSNENSCYEDDFTQSLIEGMCEAIFDDGAFWCEK